MDLNYFAYGSNLFAPRLVRRVPSTQVYKTAVLPGHELRFHKNGADGSAKANAFFTDNEQHQVHGVVYKMTATERHLLDCCEGGYDRHELEVLTDIGPVTAFTYIAQPELLDESLSPFHWYKAYVQQGAQQHGLMSDYIARIDAQHSIDDPDPMRQAEHFNILGLSPA